MPELSLVSVKAPFQKTVDRLITFASFGDSLSVVYDVSNTDCTPSVLPASSYNNYAATTRCKIQHFGYFYLIGNGGISGQTTQQMLERGSLSYSATRRSIWDVAKLQPDFVRITCGINDVLLINAYDQSAVDAIIARRIKIINEFIRLGITVIDPCLYGYSGAVAEPALTARRNAVLYINNYFRNLNKPGYYFADMSGVICQSDGSIDVSNATDGVHPTEKGQMKADAVCASIANRLFSAKISRGIINDWKYEFGNSSGGNPSGYTSIIDSTINSRTCDSDSMRVNITSTLATQDFLIALPISTYLTNGGFVAGNTVHFRGKMKAQGLTCGATIRAQIYKADNSVYNIYGSINNYFENEAELSMTFELPVGFGGSSSYLRLILVDIPLGTYDVEISGTELSKVTSV
jgi:lysophospholipase L1-like esterase